MNLNISHGGGFLTSGTLAFLTDAGILFGLTRVVGLDPFSARIIAIACAMIVGYFAHRRLTFRRSEPASIGEFLKFAGVAAAATSINYSCYAAMMIFRSGTDPLAALAVASLIAMMISYAGLRFGVFKRRPL